MISIKTIHEFEPASLQTFAEGLCKGPGITGR